jgi:S-ribosylhomocysteine lyase
MGCLTGNYLLVRGDLESKDIVPLMQRTFRFVAEYGLDQPDKSQFELIPGAAPRDCGNYLLHDLPMARLEARRFLEEVLENIQPENLHYPT